MVHYRVENIDTTPLVTVTSDARVQDALEAMFSRGHPQVGVARDGELVGVVSHRSITRALLIVARSDELNSLMNRSVELVLAEPEPVVSDDDDIFTLFAELADSPYVLVERDDRYHVLRDVGFHQYLAEELEAFMLIEEIERTVREIFEAAYGDALADELRTTFEPMDLRTPGSIEECSFAHYHIFISGNWETFDPYFDENRDFVRELLDGVGDIRNALFHFRSDAQEKVIEEEYIRFVRDYLERETAARPDGG